MFRKLLPRKDIFFTYMETSAAMVVQILDAYRELVMDPSNSKERVERVGRNPKTGEMVRIPTRRVPHFIVGKALRARVENVEPEVG